MTNLDSMLKSRDITLPTEVPIVKAMVFPVVMYQCESWTLKKAFELWYWRRFLRVPWTERRSNQSILKEINPEYSLKGLNAEAPIPWPPDAKSRLIGKDPDAGKDLRQKEKGARVRMRWLDSITDSMDRNFSKLREIVEDRGSWHAAVYLVARSQIWLSDWTITTKNKK